MLLLSTILYHFLCNLVNIGKDLVENQYCDTGLPALGLGHGVGSDIVQISEYATNFKYRTNGKLAVEKVNSILALP
jgi:hypothetical protein